MSNSPPPFVSLSNQILEMKQKASVLNTSWNNVLSNNNSLKNRAATLAPLELKTVGTQSANAQSLKMQKQKDISSEIEMDNNILIITGIFLVISVLCAFSLYRK